MWEGGRYINIRVYVDNNPSKQGVTLSVSQWASVKTALGMDCGGESALGREVYMKMLREMVSSRVQDRCEGCEKGWSGQKDHACLMDRHLLREEMARLPPMDVPAYVVELATLARERGHVLERPLECYNLCANFLRQDLEDEVVSSAGFA